jgi:CheY-like chemotaxis protein
VDKNVTGGDDIEEPRGGIMVVEDDHDLRITIEDELDERGYVVYGAPNGMAAINLLRRIPPPRLILLDLMMPIMNGWDFLEAVRDDEQLSRIPVAVLTWLRHARFPQSHVLMKPLDLAALLAVVERHGDRETMKLAMKYPSVP